MKTKLNCDKLKVQNGWLYCPVCNKKNSKVIPGSDGINIVRYCDNCKTEFLVDYKEGQSFLSRSQ